VRKGHKSEATLFSNIKSSRFTFLTLLACLAASDPAVAQWMGKQTGCYADSIAANPNRPTVSNPAHVTQYGVLELEYGLDRQWQESVRQTSSGGLLKFGLLCDIELRWNTTSFLSQTDGTGKHTSFGDNWLGTEIRVHRQTTRLPTMAFGLRKTLARFGYAATLAMLMARIPLLYVRCLRGATVLIRGADSSIIGSRFAHLRSFRSFVEHLKRLASGGNSLPGHQKYR
jgi:hypothetical protein